MDHADETNTASSKRTRFDASASSKQTDEPKTPKAMGANQIKQTLALLQPSIATILSKLGLKHLSLQAKAHNKAYQVTRMETDQDFVPRSARSDFTLQVSKDAEKTPEFQSLKEATEEIRRQAELRFKLQVIEATKIETTVLKKQIAVDLATSLRLSTKAFLIAAGIEEHNLDTTMITILARHHRALLKHSFASPAEFSEVYKEVAAIATLPLPIALARTAADTNAPAQATGTATSHYFSQARSQAPEPPAPPTQPPLNATERAIDNILPRIFRHLESIFVAPWDIYLDTKKKHEIDLTLKRLETAHFTEEATEAATMDVDEEPAADMQQLQELVRKQAEIQTKALKQQVSLLEKKMQSLKVVKNAGRGNGKSASKQKEKKGPKRSTSQQRSRKKSNDEEGEAADDSSTGSSKKHRKQNSKKKSDKSKKSGGTTNTNRGRPSAGRSNRRMVT